MLSGWSRASKMRKPTLIIPAVIIGAWIVYLFIDPVFLSSFPSRSPERAGIFSAVPAPST